MVIYHTELNFAINLVLWQFFIKAYFKIWLFWPLKNFLRQVSYQTFICMFRRSLYNILKASNISRPLKPFWITVKREKKWKFYESSCKLFLEKCFHRNKLNYPSKMSVFRHLKIFVLWKVPSFRLEISKTKSFSSGKAIRILCRLILGMKKQFCIKCHFQPFLGLVSGKIQYSHEFWPRNTSTDNDIIFAL